MAPSDFWRRATARRGAMLLQDTGRPNCRTLRALRQFCCDGNLKWLSLLLWAGADPRSSGPLLEHAEDEHAQDPETHTTALDEACTWGQTEILKRMSPEPTPDDLGALLEKAAFFARRDTMAL